MQPVSAPPSYPPTSYSSRSRLVTIRAVTPSRTPGQPSSYGQQSSYGLKAAMGSSHPLVTPHPRLDPTARLQVNIVNRAAATGSRVHSSRTTPVAWVFMGRSLEDFPDLGENRSMSGLITGAGEGGFDRGGMSRGGQGGGAAVEWAGGVASIGGGPMDEGPDLDLGPPVDPDEDSDSAIYVQD